MGRTAKRIVHGLAATAITAAALAYALWGVDWARLGHLLQGADYRLLLPFEAFLVAFYGFNALRWAVILRPLGRFGLGRVTPAMMIGFAGNNVLPAHLGELVRAVVFARGAGLPASSVFMTLVVERLLDVLAILLLTLAAVLWVDPFPASLVLGAEVAAGVTAVAALAIAAFLRFPEPLAALWERLTAWLPWGLSARGAAVLRAAAGALAALKAPGLVAAMLAWSLLKWAACGAMVALSLRAFGAAVPFGVGLIVVAVIALAVTVPTAPGFFGAMQAAFVFALVPFGISQETALAASVLYLLAQWVPVTAVGGACFAALGLHFGQVRSEAEHLRPVD